MIEVSFQHCQGWNQSFGSSMKLISGNSICNLSISPMNIFAFLTALVLADPTLEPECSGPGWPRAMRFVWWLIAGGCTHDSNRAARQSSAKLIKTLSHLRQRLWSGNEDYERKHETSVFCCRKMVHGKSAHVNPMFIENYPWDSSRLFQRNGEKVGYWGVQFDYVAHVFIYSN